MKKFKTLVAPQGFVLWVFLLCLPLRQISAQPGQSLILQDGFGLQKGEVYYQAGDIFWQNLQLGLSDQLSLGVGTIPFFTFSDAIFPYTFSLKYSMPRPNERFNASLNLFHFAYLDEGEWYNVMLVPYYSMSFGSRRKHVTVSAGAIFGDFDSYYYTGGLEPFIDPFPNPFFGLGFHLQGKSRWAFISDNMYFSPEHDFRLFISSAGIRHTGRKVWVDVGFGMSVEEYSYQGEFSDRYFVPLPWLGFSVPLNKKTRNILRNF